MNDTLTFLYGMVTATYFCSAAYVFLTAASYLGKGYNKQIPITFFVGACGYACFGFYNLFFQQYQGSGISNIAPDWLLYYSRFGGPLALMLITYLTVQSTLLRSYKAYVLTKQFKWFIWLLYALDLACLVAVGLTPSVNTASLLIMLCFIPHSIASAVLSFVGLGNLFLGRIMGWAFVSCSVTVLALAWLMWQGSLPLGEPGLIIMHLYFAGVVLIFSFCAARFGYTEILRFFKIKNIDQKNIVHEILNAVHENQFYLEYQPKLNLDTMKVDSLEALVRWRHPTQGFIPPDSFIRVSEETGMIDEITKWVLNQAFMELKQMQALGQEFQLAVNLSPLNINPDMLKTLKELLSTHDVDPKRITLEITENFWILDSEESETLIDEFKATGIQLSLDDYGTGHSSLQYFHKLNFNELKIDRSFIEDLANNTTNQAVVQSTIEMGKRLGLKVVVEGLENPSDIATLKGFGADSVQGYGISKPLNQDELLQWTLNPS